MANYPDRVTFDRAENIRRLGDDAFDVLVVGGGITGAGVALDAASRGLRTALVDKGDLASGTSSKSSKLIHGGIRYLQQKEIGLVYEALAERQILRATAPHLVRVLPFLLPVFTKDGLLPRRIARLLGATMWAYDLTGGLRIGRLHKRISKEEARRNRTACLRPRDIIERYYGHQTLARISLCPIVSESAGPLSAPSTLSRCSRTHGKPSCCPLEYSNLGGSRERTWKGH